MPTPIVFLDEPGGTYWEGWRRFTLDHVAAGGYISAEDLGIVTITDDVEVAVEAVLGFYRNYRSIRWVGKTLVVRLVAEPTDDEVAMLNDEFGALLAETGRIERSGPLPPEVKDGEQLDLPRLVMDFDIRHFGQLHAFIHRLNELGSAPATTPALSDPPRG